MNANKALWEKGDFTHIAETMRESGQALVEELGISEGLQVLDLGSGDGTTALPAAQLGAEVLGVDIAANLVAAGNARAQRLGLTNCTFQEGDASPSELLAEFKTYYGGTMNAFEAAAANGREVELHAELDALFREQNMGDDATSIPATFLRVTVKR